ncbi:SH3 domain-containing protein [bacterium]|jgi:hypothetical protein|nr:SH3 domain-containing protein [bacterium]
MLTRWLMLNRQFIGVKRLRTLLTSCIILVAGIISVGYDYPTEIEIMLSGGVSVRKDISKKSKQIGYAYSDYKYVVNDFVVGYYKIRLSDGKYGWLFANPKKPWVKESKNGEFVKITHKSAINVREYPFDTSSDIVSIASPGESFQILGIRSSYYKIVLPSKRKGWVYANSPKKNWMRVSNTSRAGKKKTNITPVKMSSEEKHFYINFEDELPVSNGDVSLHQTEYIDESGGSISLYESNSSEIKFTFVNLVESDSPDKLILRHLSQRTDDDDLKGRAPIDITINSNSVVHSLDPGSHDLFEDILNISKFVKYGENKVSIKLKDANTPYRIQSLQIK